MRYKAIESGCDDFNLKPFQSRELVLRIAANLRRSNKSDANDTSAILTMGGFSLDCNSRTIILKKNHKLGVKESLNMKLMLENVNEG